VNAALSHRSLLWDKRLTGARYLENLARVERWHPEARSLMLARFMDHVRGERYRMVRVPGAVYGARLADRHAEAEEFLRAADAELSKVNWESGAEDETLKAHARSLAGLCRGMSDERLAEFLREQDCCPCGKPTPKGLRRRGVSRDFWLKRLRAKLPRELEESLRRLGCVNRARAPYLTDTALATVTERARKAAAALEHLSLVDRATGEYIESVAAVSARSLANPANRFAELVTRVRGHADYAKAHGHAATFATVTCPSCFHAELASGGRNPAYNGATVREAQAWLRARWQRVRQAIHRAGLEVYGFRVAEPHHDGTPHWHLVLFAPARDLERAEGFIRRTWLRQFADEPGAAEHRVRFERADDAKGSVVGYMVKYLQKSIGGARTSSGAPAIVEGDAGRAAAAARDFDASASDSSALTVGESANRATAWARLHGIRQFQVMGEYPIGLWRLIRRADAKELAELAPEAQELHGWASRTPDYAKWLEALRRYTGHVDAYEPALRSARWPQNHLPIFKQDHWTAHLRGPTEEFFDRHQQTFAMARQSEHYMDRLLPARLEEEPLAMSLRFCARMSRPCLMRDVPRSVDPQGRSLVRLTQWGELPAARPVGFSYVARISLRSGKWRGGDPVTLERARSIILRRSNYVRCNKLTNSSALSVSFRPLGPVAISVTGGFKSNSGPGVRGPPHSSAPRGLPPRI
jgi:hypothetical protein